MIIKTADFIISNTDVKRCPKEQLPEYAFIGRSNVGKSSLINMLTGHSKLAKTSGKPGKTQLINHFKINTNWFLVDLPGYGYAKVSKSLRQGFQEFIKDYFLQREQLICTFVLVDSRLEPQKIDLEFMEFLGENGIAFCIVFTKSDKLKLSQLNRNVQIYSKTMTSTIWESMPPYFTTSATDASGKEELLTFIDDLNQKVLENS
ncbi:ribosome biogenesis GTP-binding protein YihA/YsxC [Lutibacter sp.]|jgi:GTP-binding protein|uniref:ribosome biogenesis GTP-binding protein YihA/YsxC n=1 Tax=Lutibacter sp. TaxID=1925666 RepID=UPI001A2EFBC9|nr:ribosome biogenesis GTP-binding protein YihA/YsxC [Lutibacter sp.]MBI9041607.1 YihA family ribosome biogenesis GTP-binding protein [Lutibacter sp.]